MFYPARQGHRPHSGVSLDTAQEGFAFCSRCTRVEVHAMGARVSVHGTLEQEDQLSRAR